jgi:hypothetical protein
MQINKVKGRPNRALVNRPQTKEKSRISDISNKNHSCSPENGGHDFKFLRFDRYGFCSKCQDEILA